MALLLFDKEHCWISEIDNSRVPTSEYSWKSDFLVVVDNANGNLQVSTYTGSFYIIIISRGESFENGQNNAVLDMSTCQRGTGRVGSISMPGIAGI